MKYIGTDSVAHKDRIKYVTVVVDLPSGTISRTVEYTAPKPTSARLEYEAALTLQKWVEVGYPEDVELHFDYNPNPKHKSYKQYLAWRGIKNAKFKPNAWAASCVADYFANH